MGNSASSNAVTANADFLVAGQQAKLRGVVLQAVDLAQLNVWIAATPRWDIGKRLRLVTEPDVEREWSGTDALKAWIAPGLFVTLADNLNQVRTTTGIPTTGGRTGDRWVDRPAGVYYTQAGASTWSAAATLSPALAAVSAAAAAKADTAQFQTLTALTAAVATGTYAAGTQVRLISEPPGVMREVAAGSPMHARKVYLSQIDTYTLASNTNQVRAVATTGAPPTAGELATGITGDLWLDARGYAYYLQTGAATAGNAVQIGVPVDTFTAAAQPSVTSSKLTVQSGRVLMGGVDVRTTGINAHDLLADFLNGGTAYVTQLPTIASYGVKLIRVNIGPIDAATWTAQVGANGAAPVSTFLPIVRTFLDVAAANGLGVVLVLFWDKFQLPAALSSVPGDYLTTGSVTRTYMRAFAATCAKAFTRHTGLAAWQVGTEWFDAASIANFASGTTDTTLDHLGALRAVCSEVVAAIRLWDNDRAVLSPSGANGRYEATDVRSFIGKLLRAAGDCDVVDVHLYPDSDAGFTRIGTGSELGGLDLFVPMLRNAAMKVGKAIMVGECGAEFDYVNNSSQATGARSLKTWQASHAAGVECVFDWNWWAADPANESNLRTVRVAVMNLLQSHNATLTPGFVAPRSPFPKPGAFALPAQCARGTGAADSWMRIPAHADLSLDTTATAKMVQMAWIRRRAVLDGSVRLFANNNTTQGFLVSSNSSNGIAIQLAFGGTFTSFAGEGGFFSYPGDAPADPAVSYPGEWVHLAWSWDGTQNAATWGDNQQHLTIWINGHVVVRSATTGKTPSGTTDRDLYLLANSDGASGFAKADVFDYMIGKGFSLTDQALADYLRFGTVPTGVQHRWKCNGNAQDSIGTLHGVAGTALLFAPNGLGNQG